MSTALHILLGLVTGIAITATAWRASDGSRSRDLKRFRDDIDAMFAAERAEARE